MEVGARLEALVDGSPYRAMSRSHRALLVFAISEEPGPDGETALHRLISAFHGMDRDELAVRRRRAAPVSRRRQ